MVRSAADVLNDPTRAFAALLHYPPSPHTGNDRPLECECIDVILQFHTGQRFHGGRFHADYRDARKKLDWLVYKFELILPFVVLRPASLESVPAWTLTVMLHDWSGPRSEYDDYTKHDLWYDLYHLHATLQQHPRPQFQRTTFKALPRAVKSRIVGVLDMPDVRSLASVNRELAALSLPRVMQEAKVSLWYNHAYLSSRKMYRLLNVTGSPPTPFGQSVACLWGWFEHRARSRTASAVRSLAIANRWQWARYVYAESLWNARAGEVSVLSPCIQAGLTLLSNLQSLDLTFLMLSNDILTAIARHPVLRRLSLTGCGILLHESTRFVPAMLRLREMRLSWDPLSAMEAATTDTVLPLAPNVWNLTLVNRVPQGPPLRMSPTWTPPRFPHLHTLAVAGAHVSLATSLLSRSRSARLSALRVCLSSHADRHELQHVLCILTRWRATLEELVLQGFEEPDARTIVGLSTITPCIRRLAIFPSHRNQTRRRKVDWRGMCYDVATSLARLRHLEELCLNLSWTVGAVGPACMVAFENASWCYDSDVVTTEDDFLDEDRAAAIPFAARLSSLRRMHLVFDAGRAHVQSFAVARAAGQFSLSRITVYGESSWWSPVD
ncbi:hypothetical protein AURDEDRAFT_170882 [Auricularia subglabra TFB-10046 SS5]|nr:hypothetical protein AURDEDRAFT_170882 [Auricularia subglabra TFB-10046 SS5]